MKHAKARAHTHRSLHAPPPGWGTRKLGLGEGVVSVAASEYLVHTISVQCLLLDHTTLDCVVRSTDMRRTPPKLHRMFGDDVSPPRWRQNLPVFRLVIVAIK